MSKIAPIALFIGLMGLASYPLLMAEEADPTNEGGRDFLADRDPEQTGLERLEGELRDIMTSLATGELDPSAGEAIRVRILVILQEEAIGRTALRGPSVNQTLETVLHEARQAGERTEALSQMQRSAIATLASQAANELVARVSGGERDIEILGPVPEGYQTLPWSILANFDWQESMELPETVRTFNESQVAVHGVLMALDSDTEYLLVQSLWSCCYGEPPSMNEAIVVHFVEGTEVASGVPVRILGTIRVGEQREDGEVIGLYRIDADQIQVGQ